MHFDKPTYTVRRASRKKDIPKGLYTKDPKNGETVFNYSADDMREAVRAVEMGRPAVYAAPKDTAEQWPRTFQGVKFVRCPAELSLARKRWRCSRCS